MLACHALCVHVWLAAHTEYFTKPRNPILLPFFLLTFFVSMHQHLFPYRSPPHIQPLPQPSPAVSPAHISCSHHSCTHTHTPLPLTPPPRLLSLPPDERGKFDEVVEDKGVRVIIDPSALMHVLGTKMDYVEDKLKWVVLGAGNDYHSHESCCCLGAAAATAESCWVL